MHAQSQAQRRAEHSSLSNVLTAPQQVQPPGTDALRSWVLTALWYPLWLVEDLITKDIASQNDLLVAVCLSQCLQLTD